MLHLFSVRAVTADEMVSCKVEKWVGKVGSRGPVLRARVKCALWEGHSFPSSTAGCHTRFEIKGGEGR